MNSSENPENIKISTLRISTYIEKSDYKIQNLQKILMS